MEIQSISTIELDPFLRVALVGNSGSGKTYCLHTLPGKTLVLTFDPGGINSLLEHLNIDFVDYSKATPESWKRFDKDFTTLIDSPKQSYDNLVIDSLTKLQDRILDYTVTEPTTATWKRARMGERKLSLEADYGFLIDVTNWIIDNFLSLKCNTILTAHIQLFEDKLTSSITQMPLIVGKKAPGRFGIPFDEVYFCDIDPKFAGTNGRIWRTKRFGNVEFIKSRIEGLPEVLPQDFTEIMSWRQRMIERRKEKNDAS